MMTKNPELTSEMLNALLSLMSTVDNISVCSVWFCFSSSTERCAKKISAGSFFCSLYNFPYRKSKRREKDGRESMKVTKLFSYSSQEVDSRFGFLCVGALTTCSTSQLY